MLVGTKYIDEFKLSKSVYDITTLNDFVLSLIPTPLVGIPEILMNQKYVVAITLRKCEAIEFNKRHALCTQLLEGVSITGVMNEIYDWMDIITTIPPEALSLLK